VNIGSIGVCVLTKFRELLEDHSYERPNGAVTAVPKLLRIDRNPNVFVSPSKPRVIGISNRLLC